jgi:hypothetical protein
MEGKASLEAARKIMGSNFIGTDELSKVSVLMGIAMPDEIPGIPFGQRELENRSHDSILILITNKTIDGNPLTINVLRNKLGTNPDIFEPCFYNQDWYIKEEFANQSPTIHWALFKKNVDETLRGVDPNDMNASKINSLPFIQAVSAVFVFFVWYFINGEILWKSDFLWCKDLDSNGDRIYIGKYLDPNGINKNGLEIHRHLKIRDNYSYLLNY